MRRLFRRHAITIIACIVVLAGFQFLMCAIVATTDVSGALQQLASFVPPIFQAMISQTLLGGGSTDATLIAFGWNHPITHALAMVLPITLGSRAIAGERENGTIELVMTQPISRSTYLLSHIAFALLAIASMAAAGTGATALGQALFGLDSFPIRRLLELLFAFWLLQTAVFAVTLAFSAFGREAGRVAFLGVLVALVSYLVEAVATLWPRALWLGPYSLHHYFQPRALLVEGTFAMTTIAVLLGVFLVATTIALVRFQRIDLP
jgi:ABC-2 type transport system permease protein